MMPITSENRQRGMTMIEIMVAMLLGVFLVGGVLQIFTSTKQTYRMQENLSRMQENARFAMEYISRDIRIADYWGCLGSGVGVGLITNQLDDTDPNYDPALHDFSTAISGTNGTAGANAALDIPDSITLRGAKNTGTAVVQAMPNTSADIKVAAGTAPSQFDIVVISDCSTADIFEVTNDPSTGTGTDDQVLHNSGNVAEGPGNDPPGKVSKSYGLDARIYGINNIVYSIQNGEGGQPGLFRKINSDSTTELVEGIENMQILYGEDANGDFTPDYFVPAGTAGLNMDQVVSIQVSLLVISIDDNLSPQSIAYTYNGTSTTPTDRKIRRVFTSTLAVRNRLR